MNDRSEIPVSPIKRAEMMEKILTTSATGGPNDDHVYEVLRREFMKDPGLKELLPEFVRTYRNLSAFWPFIKNAAGTYAERRQIISMAFTPLIEHLEDRRAMPGDQIASDALESFDTEGVYQVWFKALARRSTDPEGAITIARTLLETVAKRILDELDEEYESSSNLPKLYAKVANALNLAPNQHTEEPIKKILGGAMNLVNGIGTLRNRLSDSHGWGGRLPVKPSPRHANLAVNTAGAIATFLVETYLERRRQSGQDSRQGTLS